MRYRLYFPVRFTFEVDDPCHDVSDNDSPSLEACDDIHAIFERLAFEMDEIISKEAPDCVARISFIEAEPAGWMYTERPSASGAA